MGRSFGCDSTTFLYSAQIAGTSWWVTRSMVTGTAAFSAGLPVAPGLRSPRSDPCSVATSSSPLRELGGARSAVVIEPSPARMLRRPAYGVCRDGVRGNGVVSRMCSASEHPPEDALDAEAKSRVRDAAVRRRSRYRSVLGDRGSGLGETFGQERDIGLAARTADHLPVPLRSEEVRGLDRPRVVRRTEHVERLQLAGKVRDEDGGVGFERQRAFLRGPEVAPPAAPGTPGR